MIHIYLVSLFLPDGDDDEVDVRATSEQNAREIVLRTYPGCDIQSIEEVSSDY